MGETQWTHDWDDGFPIFDLFWRTMAGVSVIRVAGKKGVARSPDSLDVA